LLPPLAQYRTRLEGALERKDFAETLLAEQIVLEGLGEAILARIEAGLAKRDAPFRRLRRVLVHQEEAHHAFGRRTLDRMLASGETSTEVLRACGADYLVLAQAMVEGLASVFASIDEDASAWAADVFRYMPEWLTR
jgi:hypothetical protein